MVFLEAARSGLWANVPGSFSALWPFIAPGCWLVGQKRRAYLRAVEHGRWVRHALIIRMFGLAKPLEYPANVGTRLWEWRHTPISIYRPFPRVVCRRRQRHVAAKIRQQPTKIGKPTSHVLSR